MKKCAVYAVEKDSDFHKNIKIINMRSSSYAQFDSVSFVLWSPVYAVSTVPVALIVRSFIISKCAQLDSVFSFCTLISNVRSWCCSGCTECAQFHYLRMCAAWFSLLAVYFDLQCAQFVLFRLYWMCIFQLYPNACSLIQFFHCVLWLSMCAVGALPITLHVRSLIQSPMCAVGLLPVTTNVRSSIISKCAQFVSVFSLCTLTFNMRSWYTTNYSECA